MWDGVIIKIRNKWEDWLVVGGARFKRTKIIVSQRSIIFTKLFASPPKIFGYSLKQENNLLICFLQLSSNPIS